MITLNASAFLKSFREARARLPRLVLAAVLRAARLARNAAKGSTLFKSRTGNLRNSIKVVQTGPLAAQAVTNAKYAEWVERGNGFRTGAQYIYPKKHPFLVFNLDGQKIVARRVRTSAPRPFMEQAEQQTAPLFERMCREAVDHMFA